MHPNCEVVNHILEAAGLPGRVRILDEAVSTARAAAEHLGCPVGAIANSLIFATDGGEPLLIMTSGAHRVDMIKVGEQLGVELRRASPDFVRKHSGQPIGGVAPVGHPKPIQTLVDRTLADFDQLWGSGRHPPRDIPADLWRPPQDHTWHRGRCRVRHAPSFMLRTYRGFQRLLRR
jgi:prolyl-tRNA editing enzyme YbaK/EbsC (Cys-tRNA(Pro) deacylase)